jgi:hypothetical protein
VLSLLEHSANILCFNIEKLKFVLEQKTIISLKNVYLLVFVLEMLCLFCEVVTGFVNIMSHQHFKIICCQLGYDTMKSHRWVLMFWKKTLGPPSG